MAAPVEAAATDPAPDGDTVPAEVPTPADPVATPDPAKPAEPAPEPPGMAQVRKAEQHMRRQLAEERQRMLAEIEQQKTATQERITKAASIEAKLATARQDPLAAIQSLGFTEADFDALGRMIYAASPEGQKNPANRAVAQQSLAQREHATALEKLQREIAELKQGITQREQQQAQQAQLDAYLDKVTKALVPDSAPLLHAALNKAPERTRAALAAIADRLWLESGPSDDLRDVPTPAEVHAAYERQRAEELEELGIDPKTIGRPAASAPTPAPAPQAARPAATLAPSGAAAPIVPKPVGPPSREEVLANLAKFRQGQLS